MLKGKTVIVGVTGSIAAYKAATLVSLLMKSQAEVHVIMTQNATNIINPITFETLSGNKCLIDTFDRNFEFDVKHISLAQKANLFIIAPATANIIAKIANGIADDMLSTTFLATKCQKMICPAMNTAMYENQITQDNIKKCIHYGMKIIEPSYGHLACGDTGKGKLPEPEFIMKHIIKEICYPKDLLNKKILVTAGPTQESIDPVRYITNHSTGKMGFAIATAAANRGADVILISGPVNLEDPLFVKTIKITSAKEMFESVKENYSNVDIIIKSAAVADYKPKVVSSEKIKKKDDELSIELDRTDDILKWLGQNRKQNQYICGFAMETQNLIENARAKLEKKNIDMIVANSLRTEGAGFGHDTNVVTLITKDKIKELPLLTKDEVAHTILQTIKENKLE